MSAKSPSKSSDVALRVEHVSKSFHLPTEQANGIKQAFVNRVKGIKGYTEQQVLKDISFTVEKGDFFGIVGRNGSGKSTLLKLISQIYTPNQGKITVNGKLVPFIELGVGFNPELTGRENIYLNGALLGFSHEEMSAMYEDIVKFAELEDFMDQKLKNYSSGMQVRLAFSIAIKADADILVLDEVLAVGDEAFQRKCYQYFAELKRNKKTVILVTHDMDSVRRFCNRAILIDSGKIAEIGDPAKVAQKYSELFVEEEDKGVQKRDGSVVNENVEAKINLIRKDGKLVFDIIVRPKINIDEAAVVFLINRSSGERVYRWATDINDINDIKLSEDFMLHIEIDDVFPVGDFFAGISIVSKDRTRDFAVFDNLIEFKKILPPGKHKLDINWKPKEEYQIRNI